MWIKFKKLVCLGPFWLFALALTLPAQADAPQKIISVGGDVTEIVYALGAEERLAAVDTSSTYPDAASDLPDVGYMRRLSAEPIVALQPDAVLASADAGPPPALAKIKAAGVQVVEIPERASPDGVVAKIRAVAKALGLDAEGERLASEVATGFESSKAVVERYDKQPRVLFLLSAGSGAPRAAGAATEATRIIQLAGARNAVTGFEGYKPLTPEAAAAAKPDVILVGNRTLDALGGRAKLAERPAIAVTPAGRNQRIVAMDTLSLLGFGPRTPGVIRELAQSLHERAPE